MRNVLIAIAVAASMHAQAYAQVQGSDFVIVELDTTPYDTVWLNLRHMHSIQQCHRGRVVEGPLLACVHMDDDDVHGNSRIFRSRKHFTQAVRDILSLPNPTTPAAVVTAPDVATVGTPITLSVAVADPDYGDSWAYSWGESPATVKGGTFDAQAEPETSYTPASPGVVIVQVTVTDDADQAATASHRVTVAAGGGNQ